MTTFKDISTIILIFGVFGTLCYVASANPNTHLVTKICNDDIYSPQYAYAISWNIDKVLDDVVLYTSSNGYSYYSSAHIPSTLSWIDAVYGHGACYGELSGYDCDACMKEAYYKIVKGCPKNTRAQVKLQDCRIRYETYPFTE